MLILCSDGCRPVLLVREGLLEQHCRRRRPQSCLSERSCDALSLGSCVASFTLPPSGVVVHTYQAHKCFLPDLVPLFRLFMGQRQQSHFAGFVCHQSSLLQSRLSCVASEMILLMFFVLV